MQQTIQDMTDGERVLRAANALDMSEFEVFRRAYNDWFDSEVDRQSLEQGFARYMNAGSAPRWVRHYAHMVMDTLHTRTDRSRNGAYATSLS